MLFTAALFHGAQERPAGAWLGGRAASEKLRARSIKSWFAVDQAIVVSPELGDVRDVIRSRACYGRRRGLMMMAAGPRGAPPRTTPVPIVPTT